MQQRRARAAQLCIHFCHRIPRLLGPKPFANRNRSCPLPFDNPIAVAIICGVFGLLIGSFLNVVVYRLPVRMKRGWAKDASEYLAESEIHEALALAPEDRIALANSASRVDAALTRLPRLTPCRGHVRPVRIAATRSAPWRISRCSPT